MNTAAKMNSFQAVMKEKSAVTATAGNERGNMIFQKTIAVEAPSMSAASSSSLGMVSK